MHAKTVFFEITATFFDRFSVLFLEAVRGYPWATILGRFWTDFGGRQEDFGVQKVGKLEESGPKVAKVG